MRRARLALLAATAAVCAYPAARAAVPQTASPISIPIELATRHVIVKATVNKSRPLSFVLDTGADTAIVRSDVAKELGLTLEGNVSIGGAGPGTQSGSLVRNATWSLVGLHNFSQPVALTLPLIDLSTAMGRDIDGIIGGTFIREFVVELDYQALKVTLHDRATFAYSGRGAVLPLEFNNGHPVVTGIVTPLGGQPLKQRFLLDIGSGGALVLHSPFVAEQNLLGPGSTTIRALGGAGAGGQTAGRMGRVEALQLGPYTLKQPITMFSQDKAGAFASAVVSGNIGAQIANRFRLFFDYGRRRLILEPLATLDDPFDRAFSGITLRAAAPDYRVFRVRNVLEASPASEAGIEAGDVLVSIDDKPAGAMTLSTINEMFEKPVSYALEIKRGERTIRVTLTPRRLI